MASNIIIPLGTNVWSAQSIQSTLFGINRQEEKKNVWILNSIGPYFKGKLGEELKLSYNEEKDRVNQANNVNIEELETVIPRCKSVNEVSWKKGNPIEKKELQNIKRAYFKLAKEIEIKF